MVSKKTNKLRGKRTHGYGSKKKHRGKGSTGGKGFGGLSKHRRSYVYAKKKDHFGKKGFYLNRKKKVINVGDLEKTFSSSEINLTKSGYDKLLGFGETKKPLNIIVVHASENAVKKIESSGGSVKTQEVEK